MDFFLKAAWTAAACCCFVSCASVRGAAELQFQIEAYYDPGGAGPALTYRVIPPHEAHAQDLLDALDFVRLPLAERGFTAIDDGAPADLEITVTFEIIERVEPLSRYSRRFRPVTHRLRTVTVEVPDAEGKMTRVQEQVIEPVDHIRQPAPHPRRFVIHYEKRFVITARATKPAPTPRGSRELWRVVVTNKDGSDDAATYSRLMLAVAANYIARRTDVRQLVTIPSHVTTHLAALSTSDL